MLYLHHGNHNPDNNGSSPYDEGSVNQQKPMKPQNAPVIALLVEMRDERARAVEAFNYVIKLLDGESVDQPKLVAASAPEIVAPPVTRPVGAIAELLKAYLVKNPRPTKCEVIAKAVGLTMDQVGNALNRLRVKGEAESTPEGWRRDKPAKKVAPSKLEKEYQKLHDEVHVQSHPETICTME